MFTISNLFKSLCFFVTMYIIGKNLNTSATSLCQLAHIISGNQLLHMMKSLIMRIRMLTELQNATWGSMALVAHVGLPSMTVVMAV
jgi:hypothetical protein